MSHSWNKFLSQRQHTEYPLHLYPGDVCFPSPGLGEGIDNPQRVG